MKASLTEVWLEFIKLIHIYIIFSLPENIIDLSQYIKMR